MTARRFDGEAAVVRVGSDENGIIQVYNEGAVLEHLQQQDLPVPSVWHVGKTERGRVYSVVEFIEVLKCYLGAVLEEYITMHTGSQCKLPNPPPNSTKTLHTLGQADCGFVLGPQQLYLAAFLL